MKLFNLKDYIGGWFVGNFSPTIINTKDFEIAIKEYKTGDYEKPHIHKIAKEIAIIVCGEVLMNNIKYSKGDIILIEPNDKTDFNCLTDIITVVVKIPSIVGDKYVY